MISKAIATIMLVGMIAQGCGDGKDSERTPVPDKGTESVQVKYSVIGKTKNDNDDTYTLVIQRVDKKEPPYPLQVLAPAYQGCSKGETFTLRDDGTPSCGVGN